MRIIAICILLVVMPVASPLFVSSAAEASSSFRMPRISSPRAPRATKTPKTTGPVVAFKRATCKSPTCFAKHPTGEYMIPIRNKAQ